MIVLDNLKEGVAKPDVYDPALNTVYRDMLELNVPVRVRRPNPKGRAERGVAHAQNEFRELRFETPQAVHAYIDRFETSWAETRIHATTKRQVRLMLEGEPGEMRQDRGGRMRCRTSTAMHHHPGSLLRGAASGDRTGASTGRHRGHPPPRR